VERTEGVILSGPKRPHQDGSLERPMFGAEGARLAYTYTIHIIRYISNSYLSLFENVYEAIISQAKGQRVVKKHTLVL